MSEALKQWMYNIIIFILFSSLIQHLAAEKKYEKYIKFFSGLLLVMVVISPVLNWFGSDKILEFNYLEENFVNEVSIIGTKKEFVIISLNENMTKKDLLTKLLDSPIEIERFENYKPSLNDIFVAKAGDE